MHRRQLAGLILASALITFDGMATTVSRVLTWPTRANIRSVGRVDRRGECSGAPRSSSITQLRRSGLSHGLPSYCCELGHRLHAGWILFTLKMTMLRNRRDEG